MGIFIDHKLNCYNWESYHFDPSLAQGFLLSVQQFYRGDYFVIVGVSE